MHVIRAYGDAPNTWHALCFPRQARRADEENGLLEFLAYGNEMWQREALHSDRSSFCPIEAWVKTQLEAIAIGRFPLLNPVMIPIGFPGK